MIYTFAILLAPAPDQQPLGIKGKPIEYLQSDRLVAAIEEDVDIEALNLLPEAELIQAIIRHDQIICELFTTHTVLPLRFGKTAFTSRETLIRHLQKESDKLTTILEKLEGYAEFLITGTATAPKLQPLADLKGKEYLLAKRSQYLEQEKWRSQLQQEIDTYLQIISASLNNQVAFHKVEPQGGEDWRGYILLPRSHAEAVQTALQEWESAHPHWQIGWSQALPPYHFL